MTKTAREPGGTTRRPAAGRDGSPSEMLSDGDGFVSEPSATADDTESLPAATSPEPPEAPEAPASQQAVRRASIAVIGLGSDLETITKLAIKLPEGGHVTWTADELQDRTDEELLEEVRKRLTS